MGLQQQCEYYFNRGDPKPRHYSLSNNCTKNYYNRTLTVQVIVEDVYMDFFETQCINEKEH